MRTPAVSVTVVRTLPSGVVSVTVWRHYKLHSEHVLAGQLPVFIIRTRTVRAIHADCHAIPSPIGLRRDRPHAIHPLFQLHRRGYSSLLARIHYRQGLSSLQCNDIASVCQGRLLCLDAVMTLAYGVIMAGKKRSARAVGIARTNLVQIRVTPDEKAQWQEAAAADHRKVSDWLRLLAAAAIEAAKSEQRHSRARER